MGIVIDKLEVLALKKLAVICGALGQSLKDQSAAKEQRALTSVLVAVINRAEIDNGAADLDEQPANEYVRDNAQFGMGS